MTAVEVRRGLWDTRRSSRWAHSLLPWDPSEADTTHDEEDLRASCYNKVVHPAAWELKREVDTCSHRVAAVLVFCRSALLTVSPEATAWNSLELQNSREREVPSYPPDCFYHLCRYRSL
jgi:hypothetical protein